MTAFFTTAFLLRSRTGGAAFTGLDGQIGECQPMMFHYVLLHYICIHNCRTSTRGKAKNY